MLDTLVPVAIRPQLVPFLFKELEGKKACYDEKHVNSARFCPSSSLTKYLYQQIEYKKKRKKQDEFILYLTVDRKKKVMYNGDVYLHSDKVTSQLMMTENKVRDFNNLIEDIFRISILYFVEGCVAGGMEITTAINMFIDKYDLLEVGFDDQAIRQLYYRDKKEPRLTRIQSQSANRVYNYSG